MLEKAYDIDGLRLAYACADICRWCYVVWACLALESCHNFVISLKQQLAALAGRTTSYCFMELVYYIGVRLGHHTNNDP